MYIFYFERPNVEKNLIYLLNLFQSKYKILLFTRKETTTKKIKEKNKQK